jgi:phytoene dehydrogenase-like protein
MEQYDAIVIGAGPNGLTCAAYLAKAGVKTLLVEKKLEIGGGLATESWTTPFLFNLHATYLFLAELMPPYRDLQLEKYNVKFIRPETQIAFLYKDDTSLVFYLDPKKSVDSISQFSRKDGEAFERMYYEFKQMADECLIPATYMPPMPAFDTIELYHKTELGRKMSEIAELSPIEIIDRYGYENPRIRAALLYLATLWGINPDSKSTGYLPVLWIYRMMNAALVQGGSHMLASALAASMVSDGGKLLDFAEVDKIVVEGGTAKGIVLKDGQELRAKAVVSTLDPQATFLKLVGKENVPEDLAASAEMWQWEEWSLYTAHYGIKGEPPRYNAAKSNPDVNQALIAVMGYEAPEDVYKHISDVKAGRLPEPAGHATCSTLFDMSQGSTGPYGPLHSLRWEGWSSYELTGQQWDDIRNDYTARCFEKWMEYAPNLKKEKVLFSFGFSPLDTERRLVNMKRGSIKHGSYTMFQMGYLRPNESCSRYRTPVKGLYVGGASTYPGGTILLGSGYNAAKVVVEDLGEKVWWTPPDYVLQAQKKGYLQTEV